MIERAALRWASLAALALSVLVIGLDMTVLNVALPTLAHDLGATTAELQWIVDAYVLAFAAGMLPAGWLGDRFGRARVLLGGLGAFGVASVAAAYAGDAGTLVLARVAMGVAAAVVMPLAMALVPALFDAAERKRAVTVMVAAVGLGLPLGPVLGGLLLDRFWWGSVFLVTVPVVVVSIVACAVLLPRNHVDAPPRLDVVAVLASVTATTAVVYGLVEAPAQGWTSAVTLGWLALGAAAGGVFALRQRQSSTPLVPRALLANRLFVRGTALAALLTFVLTGVLFLVPLQLQLVMGYDAMATGLRLSPFMLALVAGGLAAERLAARLPLAAVCTAGMATVASGALSLARTQVDTRYGAVALGLALAGLGMGLVMAPVMDKVLAALPPAAEGVGSAVNNTARQVAGALGVAVLGSVAATVYADGVARAAGSLPGSVGAAARGSLAGAQAVATALPGASSQRLLDEALTASVEGLRIAMLVCAVVCAVGALLTPLLLGVPRGRGTERPAAAVPAARRTVETVEISRLDSVETS